MRGTTGGIRHLAINRLVSDPRLCQFAERNLLGATQVGVVRIVLVPATELVWLLANPGVAIAPP